MQQEKHASDGLILPGRPVLGTLALLAILAGVVLSVLFAAGGSRVLAPHPAGLFPAWEAGPLRGVTGRLPLPRLQGQEAYSAMLLVLLGAYLAAVAAASSLPGRVVAAFVGLSAVVLLLGPPMRMNDVFNYLGYARLGGAHGLDPYAHVIAAERRDAVFPFTSWRNLSSPYGPLFTALTYPLAWLPLPLAYWLLKLGLCGCGLGFVACVARCARLLGRDWRPAVLFVAANPIYLFYELGGFHNDVLMLLLSTGALMLLLARRERLAGGALVLAVAVKLTSAVLLPFLLVAARSRGRRLRLLAGVAVAAVPVAALSVALFGASVPNVSQQSGLVTGYSIPNLLGLALGLGGSSPALVRDLNVIVVMVVMLGLRRRDLIGAAGWATLALTAAIAWLMPWYIAWTLPLAALTEGVALRAVSVAMTVFLLVTFAPVTGRILARDGFDPMATHAGRAATAYERSLQWVIHHRGRRVRVSVRAERPRSGTIARRCSGCSRSEAQIA